MPEEVSKTRGGRVTDCPTFLADDSVAIFLFHGVIRENRHEVRNSAQKHLSLQTFVSILASLCAKGVPVSMPEIVAATREARALAPRAFAITFDDGFENNFSVAAPVLEEKGIPATFYVTSGFIDANGSSWIDMVEYAFEARPAFKLVLSTPALEAHCGTPQEKRQLLEKIRRAVKSQPSVDPYDFAYRVWRQLGIAGMDPDPELDQKMSWSQVRELSRNRLFTVGGHGHTHRILEFLDQRELEREIALSLEKLRAAIGVPIEHYSYPEGLANCYSDRVIALLQRHHIVCAPSAEHGVNRVGDDLFRLKRIMVT